MKRLVAFFEIPAMDFQRAVKFYENVLQVSLSVMDCEEEKMAFFPTEEESPEGAISWAKDFRPSSDGVLVSLNVNDLSETLQRVSSHGGEVMQAKTKIECDGMGFFAIFKDCEGNRLGLYGDK